MFEKLSEKLSGLLSINRKVLLFGTSALVGLLIIGGVALYTLKAPNLGLLYSSLDPSDTRQIIRILDINGITFDVRSDETEVYVPIDQVSESRVVLAGEGLPSSGNVGYELFDNQNAVGSSNLVQEVNRLRALEGELVRTISSIKDIQSARLHIVLPRRELFSREKAKPSASVVIQTIGSKQIDNSTVQTILHIVATAVPELSADDITLANERGELLAKGGGELGAFGGRSPEEIQSSYEVKMARLLESMLENIVGEGKVRAEVRAEMDFSQTVINEEVFDPDGQVVRSSETIDEQSSRELVPDQAVTVQNNIPENELLTQSGPLETENSSREEERINYEITNTTTNKIIPPGTIDRLSVAVLVDGTYGSDGLESSVYIPRSNEEMSEIERLVKSAIGYDEISRRDQVEIINLRFAAGDLLDISDGQNVFGIPVEDFREIIEALVLAIVVLLIAFWLVRPLVIRLIGNAKDQALTTIGADGQPLLVDKTTGLPITSAGSELDGVDYPGDDGEAEPVMIDGLGIRLDGNIIKRLNMAVAKYPVESANLLKDWISQK